MVPLQLRQPEFQSALRQASQFAGFRSVSVPKAPMHEDDLASACKNQVRLARKGGAVQPIPESHRVNKFPHDHLRAGILTPDSSHSLTALGGFEGVGHGGRSNSGYRG